MPQSPQASEIWHAGSWVLKYRRKKFFVWGEESFNSSSWPVAWAVSKLNTENTGGWGRESSVWCLWPCGEQPRCLLIRAFITNSQGTLPSRDTQCDIWGNFAQHMNDPRRFHFYQPCLGWDNLGKSARASIRPLLFGPPLVLSKASLQSHKQAFRFIPSSKIQSESKGF